MFQFPANPVLGQQYAPVQGVTYEWNGTGWLFLGPSTASLYPPGVILPYAGAAPLPFQGWVLCDGKSYATTALPALFAVIGYSYGGSAGNFNVPDLRGRVIAGSDSMGGSAAGRLTSVGAALGAAGGAESVVLDGNTLPSHNHGITDQVHSHGLSDPTHAHSVYDPGHAHGVHDPGHGHGVNDGGHSHGVGNNQRGTALNTNSGTGNAGFVGGADRGYTDVGGIDIWGSGANISIQGAGTGVSIHGAGTSIGIYGAGTGMSVQGSWSGINATHHAGASWGHNNVQPVIVLNYIIRA